MTENEISGSILDAAYRTHKAPGPGLLESIYEEVLAHELTKKGIPFQRQQAVPISYEGIQLGTAFKADLIVAEKVIVEIKAVEAIHPIHRAQLLTYLRTEFPQRPLRILSVSALELLRLQPFATPNSNRINKPPSSARPRHATHVGEMTTPLKRRTNRLNSKKSTGPRSSIGRRAVSQNATRHGLLGNSIILPGESEDRFRQMSQNFHDEHAPATETELALVDMLAAARWRQMRIWGIERAAINQEIIDQAAREQESQPAMDITTRTAMAFRSLADNSRSLDLINRYETANARLFFRSLHRLNSLKENLETENFQTKPNVDFPEQNEQSALLKNDPESDQPASPAPPPTEAP